MKLTPKRCAHYGLLLIAAYVAYSWFTQDQDQRGHRDTYENHPRNWDKLKDNEPGVKVKKGGGHKYADGVKNIIHDEGRSNEDQDRDSKSEFRNYKRKNYRNEEDDDSLKQFEDVEQIDDFPELAQRKKDPPKRGHDVDFDKQNFKDVNTENEKHKVKDVRTGDNRYEPEQNVKLKKEADNTHKEVTEKNSLIKNKDKEDGRDFLKEINDAALIGDPEVHKVIDKISDHEIVKIPKMKRDFGDEHDDLEVALEKTNRRKNFFEKVKKLESQIELEEDQHFHQHDDSFAFVTAATRDTYQGTLQFIHSVQTLFPQSEIGIYNLNLDRDQAKFLKTLCGVNVEESLINHLPEHIYADITQKMWRPVVLQMAASKFGHYVYLEPNRKFKPDAFLKPYFERSTKGGVLISGTQKRYSTYVVTHPEMFLYLAVNVKKLLKIPHVELNMVIVHNTVHVRHYFARWVFQCTLEKWCIAPPGSQRKCDLNLYPNSKKWANCHRYDESVINTVLASWHNYDSDHYSAYDKVTTYYDGHDVTKKLKTCGSRHGDL